MIDKTNLLMDKLSILEKNGWHRVYAEEFSRFPDEAKRKFNKDMTIKYAGKKMKSGTMRKDDFAFHFVRLVVGNIVDNPIYFAASRGDWVSGVYSSFCLTDFNAGLVSINAEYAEYLEEKKESKR